MFPLLLLLLFTMKVLLSWLIINLFGNGILTLFSCRISTDFWLLFFKFLQRGEDDDDEEQDTDCGDCEESDVVDDDEDDKEVEKDLCIFADEICLPIFVWVDLFVRFCLFLDIEIGDNERLRIIFLDGLSIDAEATAVEVFFNDLNRVFLLRS